MPSRDRSASSRSCWPPTEVSRALSGVRHRVLAFDVANEEHRRYGMWAEHNAAHGLDGRGLRHRIGAFLDA